MATDLTNVFTLIHRRIAVSTAITVLQLKAGSTMGFEVLRAWMTQHTTATPAQATVSLIRKTVAATVTTAVVGTHILKHDPNGPTPQLSLGTAATGITATAEGTDGEEPWSEAFNVVNGVLWFPEKERIFVPPDGILGLKFMAAPPNQTYTAGITIVEG